jgi:hypothetical protein
LSSQHHSHQTNFPISQQQTNTTKMAKFTTVVIALAAAITGANAQIKACNAGKDYCGWGLTSSEFGMHTSPSP